MSTSAAPPKIPATFAVAVASLVTLALAAQLAMSPMHADRALVHVASDIDPAVALKSLPSQTITQLTQREKARLSEEPLDLSALANLVVLDGLSGNSSETKAIAAAAAERSYRDPLTQLTVISTFVQAKDYPNAFRHLDGLLAANPELAPQVYPGLVATLNDSNAITTLAKVLLHNPLWRSDFTSWLIKNDADGQTAFAVFNALRKAGGAPEVSETRALVSKQFSQKSYDQAYLYWMDSLSPDELLKLGNLYDGSFAFDPKNQLFGWNSFNLPNAEITFTPRNDPEKTRELRISFYNNTQPFEHVYQVTHMRRGKYMFSGEWASSRLTTPAGLHWMLLCQETGDALGKSDAFAAPSPRTAFEFAFTVPDQNCEFQSLRLVNASAAVLDAQIDGDIEFSNLKIASVAP